MTTTETTHPAHTATRNRAFEAMDDAVRHERPARWRMFSTSTWISTDPDERFTVSIDYGNVPEPHVEVRAYDTTVHVVPAGAPVVKLTLGLTTTGDAAHAAVIGLLRHLEGML